MAPRAPSVATGHRPDPHREDRAGIVAPRAGTERAEVRRAWPRRRTSTSRRERRTRRRRRMWRRSRTTRSSPTTSSSPPTGSGSRTTSRAVLRSTYREVQVQIPIRQADGRIHVYSGYRVQHNGARGPYKGGVRYHPEVDLDEVRALARSCRGRRRSSASRSAARRAASTATRTQLEPRRARSAITRSFIDKIDKVLGPDARHPRAGRQHERPGDGLDDGRVRQAPRPHAGDRHRQADLARRLATGARRRPAAASCSASARRRPRSASRPSDTRVVVQGFGNVGSWAARIIADLGAKIVGVSDAYGAIHGEAGIDVHALRAPPATPAASSRSSPASRSSTPTSSSASSATSSSRPRSAA